MGVVVILELVRALLALALDPAQAASVLVVTVAAAAIAGVVTAVVALARALRALTARASTPALRGPVGPPPLADQWRPDAPGRRRPRAPGRAVLSA